MALYNMVISAEDYELASQIGAVIDIDVRGDLTFSVPLSPTGQLPATHWGCRTYMTSQTHGILTSSTAQELRVILDTLADNRGRARVARSVINWPRSLMLNSGDIGVLLSSLGLQRIR